MEYYNDDNVSMNDNDPACSRQLSDQAETGGQHVWHQDYGYWWVVGGVTKNYIFSKMIMIPKLYQDYGYWWVGWLQITFYC